MARPEQSEDRGFQITWALLHLLAALNCVAVIMHLGSSRYHIKRAVVPPERGPRESL